MVSCIICLKLVNSNMSGTWADSGTACISQSTPRPGPPTPSASGAPVSRGMWPHLAQPAGFTLLFQHTPHISLGISFCTQPRMSNTSGMRNKGDDLGRLLSPACTGWECDQQDSGAPCWPQPTWRNTPPHPATQFFPSFSKWANQVFHSTLLLLWDWSPRKKCVWGCTCVSFRIWYVCWERLNWMCPPECH